HTLSPFLTTNNAAAGIFLPRLILIADTYIRPNPFGNGEDYPGDGSDGAGNENTVSGRNDDVQDDAPFTTDSTEK
ncbi:MAG: hypothetical protein LIQ31_16550, partial [Planctomycetes bacterium]|nr:hypothetical protein [Planctomycetota bacterium]